MNSNIKSMFLLLTVSFFAVSSAFAGSTPQAAALYGTGRITSGGVATAIQTPSQRACATTEDLFEDLYDYYESADSDETQNDICALYFEALSFAEAHCPDSSEADAINSPLATRCII